MMRRPPPPPNCLSLSDMTEEEILELERQYGCPVIRPGQRTHRKPVAEPMSWLRAAQARRARRASDEANEELE